MVGGATVLADDGLVVVDSKVGSGAIPLEGVIEGALQQQVGVAELTVRGGQ